MDYILNKNNVKSWLRKLIKQGMLVAPVELEGGDVIYKELFTPEGILLDYKKPLNSAKAFLLPQEETMFTFKGRSVESIEATFDQFPRVFFGLRPCDLRAVTQADRFFSDNYQDPYYTSRRANTLLITVGCNVPEAECFCHSMGLGPHCSEGTDIFMVDLGSCFLTTPVSAKGRECVDTYSYFFTEATEDQRDMASRKEAEALCKLKDNLPMENALSCYPKIDDEFLKSISNKCASCGSCSYVCPMCFCYNVVDRTYKDIEGKRVRTWDSCIFEGFTRMAGRHNLLKTRQDRLRKRFDHKLLQYPENYGIAGCTGCGRCTVTCLGHISMLDVIKKVSGEVDIDV